MTLPQMQAEHGDLQARGRILGKRPGLNCSTLAPVNAVMGGMSTPQRSEQAFGRLGATRFLPATRPDARPRIGMPSCYPRSRDSADDAVFDGFGGVPIEDGELDPRRRCVVTYPS
jgi:hypothetical protein